MSLSIPCGRGVHCFGTDYPISNFTSEQDDTLEYIGLSFPGATSVCVDTATLNCVGSGNVPPLGSDIISPGGCLGIGEAATQALANSLAITVAQLCGLPPAPGPAYAVPPSGTPGSTQSTLPPGGGVPNGATQIPQTAGRPGSGMGSQVFWNTEQKAQCNVCEEGTGSNYTVPAGTYSARTQELANQLAKQAATRLALANCICVPDFSADYCKGDLIDAVGAITGEFPPFQISLSGNVPPGYGVLMETATTFRVIATLTKPGTYEFTVKVADARNNTAEAQSTIDILGIDNIDSIAQGQCDNPYSFALNGAGGKPPYTFALTGGNLPNGLSLSAAGLISGTPSACETESITVQITDSSDPPRECVDTGTIEIVGPCIPPIEFDLAADVIAQGCPGPNPNPAIGYYPGDTGYTVHALPPPKMQLCSGQAGPVNIKVTLSVRYEPLANMGPYPTCGGSTFMVQPNCLINMACGSVTIPANTFIHGSFFQEYHGTAMPGDDMFLAVNGGPGGWHFSLSVIEE